MPPEPDRESPEILKHIQAAERQVERALRSAEREAEVILEHARARAKSLLAEKRRALEERNKQLLAEGIKEAQGEAERIVLEARVKSNDLKTAGMANLDRAVELVLRRILPAFNRTED